MIVVTADSAAHVLMGMADQIAAHFTDGKALAYYANDLGVEGDQCLVQVFLVAPDSVQLFLDGEVVATGKFHNDYGTFQVHDSCPPWMLRAIEDNIHSQDPLLDMLLSAEPRSHRQLVQAPLQLDIFEGALTEAVSEVDAEYVDNCISAGSPAAH